MTLSARALLAGLACLCASGAWAGGKEMALVPAGRYAPFFATKEPAKDSAEGARREPVSVASFWLDRYPVTNAQYLEFVRANPEWRKSRVKSLFTDGHYLECWKGDFALASAGARQSPVTFVSWFAAQAYCEWKGKTLPSVDQWEYAAADQGRGSDKAKKRILEWYSRPTGKGLARVGSTPKNGFGIYDLHGLVWEWTFDFNSAIQTDEARDGGAKDNNLFCGAGSQGALDPADYASFMRFSFRNSLKANYTVANLGFRCAKEAP